MVVISVLMRGGFDDIGRPSGREALGLEWSGLKPKFGVGADAASQLQDVLRKAEGKRSLVSHGPVFRKWNT